MKLVLLLICLIAVANCSNIMTTATTNLWTFTYLTPAATTTAYNFTLAYSTGETTGSTTQITLNPGSIGLICIVTTLNFTVVDTVAGSAGWSIEAASSAATVLSNTATGWGPITMTSHPGMTHTSETALTTGATSAACTLVTVANTPAYASYVHTYSNSALATCGNLAAKGVTWYGRCYHKTDTAAVMSTAATDTSIVVSGAKNVTVGASTFVTGATILAGIAYLQF
jgi:hypothetical protein